MGSGQSVTSTAEIVKLQDENKKLKEKLDTLQKSQPGGAKKSRMTMRVRESTTEKKFQRPDRRGEISAEIAKLGQYQKKEVAKDAGVEAAITKNVQGSVLFQKLGAAEQKDCVGAFYPQEADAGAEVIKQGEKGNIYFFVESGTLDVLVNVEGSGDIKMQEVKAGDGFGELALLYNTPRAATVKATSAAKLWCLERSTYNGIIQHYKRQQAKKYVEYLKNVSCKNSGGDTDLNLKNLSSTELQQLAEAMDDETFNKGEVIIRQGEKGDDFYIVATGSVTVLVDGKEVATKNAGDYFGEQALLSEDTRTATCTAAEDNTMLLSIHRENFVELLGALSELIDRKQLEPKDAALKGTDEHGSSKAVTFDDLEIKATLGCGAFGRVKLVKHKSTGETYALKCQSKAEIVENSLQDHVLDERNVMLAVDHPFILKLHNSYKDDRYIYFLLELAPGGELFTFLRKAGRFNEKAGRFYASSVLLAFEQLHTKLIVYRDLKPENLILDAKGFLKVCDFGLAKVVTDKTWTLCGTPDYLAPEIILSKGHNKAVDYWALGILIYEMCAGFVPYYSDDPMEVYQLILGGDLKFPSHFSRAAMDLVTKLLTQNSSKRLGMLKGSTKDILKHKWFAGFDWAGLLALTMTPPIVPKIKDAEDTSNFDDYPEDDTDVAICTEWDPAL
jgi:CRP-like cAMP-binding protein